MVLREMTGSKCILVRKSVTRARVGERLGSDAIADRSEGYGESGRGPGRVCETEIVPEVAIVTLPGWTECSTESETHLMGMGGFQKFVVKAWIDRQVPGPAVEIGACKNQIEPAAWWNQPRTAIAIGHFFESACNHLREIVTAQRGLLRFVGGEEAIKVVSGPCPAESGRFVKLPAKFP